MFGYNIHRFLLHFVHNEDGGSTFGHISTEANDITCKTIRKTLATSASNINNSLIL
jgi:hypothetical protein